MNIGIVVAMKKEFNPIANSLSNRDSRAHGHFSITWGNLGPHHVIAILAGIGKVHAALGTTLLIYHARPDCILSIGCSGALSSDLHVGDIVAANEVAYHDVWCGEGNAYGQVQGCPPRFACLAELTARFTANGEVKREGLFVSGEYFIPSQPMLRDLNARFSNPLATDMESAAVAQTCWIEGYPFAALRAISDTPGQPILPPTEQYLHFWENDADNAFGTIMNIIKNI